MFWQWEIAFPGGGAVPVISKNKSDGESINLAEYENMDVAIYGTVFFGIIIGDDNPGHQSMSGYRIDAVSVQLRDGFSTNNTPPDTCRLMDDMESHWNQHAIVEGRIIEYIPPRDSSKLGDEKIWDWEIVTPDNYSIPLTAKNTELDIGKYVGKDVYVNAFIFYGIIFGYENTANMRGTRIDAYEINIISPRDPASKITFNLDEFTDDGYRIRPGGEKSAIHYEFCIPASSEIVNIIRGIDSTIGVYEKSKGRSRCSDKEWLCIASSRNSDFKKVVLKLASLSYVRQISETFWE
jgi:hypothetical protein